MAPLDETAIVGSIIVETLLLIEFIAAEPPTVTWVAADGAEYVMPVKVAVPPAVDKDNVPVVPYPTVAVTCVLDTALKDVTAVPPIVIAVGQVKFVPVIVIVLPAVTVVGVTEVIVGVEVVTVKFPVAVAIPPPV